jgi:RNase H-fold protein (predicted Holliday junction resolvase)
VELFDERFTTRMAKSSGDAGTRAQSDAVAAAHMLQGFLDARKLGSERS